MSVSVASPARARRLRVERLEDRLTPSWGGVPPSTIAVPTSNVVAVTLTNNDATGTAAITNNEIDWYKFTAPAGAFTLSALTPTSNLDTVLGLYNASGQRVAYNDDISYPSNTDSRTTVTIAGGTYYLGITNYIGTAGGSYTWTVHGPTISPPPPPPPPPPPAGGFQITLRTSGLTASQQAIFQQAANRWASVITGDLPDANYNGTPVDDVLIDASGANIDGPGGILGQAGPDRLRSGSFLPYHGVMQFDSADMASLEASGQLQAVVMHEMGHVLGIGTIWTNLGLLSGRGGSDPRFTGAQATAAFNSIFNQPANTAGVPVENSGGAGTRDSHWREVTFGNELMTGYLNNGANPLSRVTVASLADMGYQVNLNAADNYSPPGGWRFSSGGGSGGTGGTGGGGNLMAEPGEVIDTVPVVDPSPTRVGRLGPVAEPAWFTPADAPTPRRTAAALDLFDHLDAITAGVNVNPDAAASRTLVRSARPATPPGLTGVELA